MAAYYNEFDPKAAAWLRELIKAGHIADGEVDERSIEDVTPRELMGYSQCHFFAGIGGWSYALRLAGWPDDRHVWTGSCPCQPFSQAGKGAGFADERHLWPAFHHLICVCRPQIVFGEQVASADGLIWLDLVQGDLEAENFAFTAVDISAAGVSAPHIRNRLYWVAESDGWKSGNRELQRGGQHGLLTQGLEISVLADSVSQRFKISPEQNRESVESGQQASRRVDAYGCGKSRLLEIPGRLREGRTAGPGEAEGGRPLSEPSGPSVAGFWDGCDWLPCTDGTLRPVEPGTFPLAHGVPARLVKLRGYGNAIVPQVAQAFIESYLDTKA